MSFILPQKVEQLPKPFVVVCEGMSDASFIDRLLEELEIEMCSVGCPSDKGCEGLSGATKLEKYLTGISVRNTLQVSSKLRGLLVVMDADINPQQQFGVAVQAMQAASFAAPQQPFRVEDIAGFRTSVFLTPGSGRNGTLEHLLLDAVFAADVALEQCVDAFTTCAGGSITTATANQQAKMKLSCLVGATCKDNPWASANLMWKDAGNPVPMPSNAFQELGDLLNQFVQ